MVVEQFIRGIAYLHLFSLEHDSKLFMKHLPTSFFFFFVKLISNIQKKMLIGKLKCLNVTLFDMLIGWCLQRSQSRKSSILFHESEDKKYGGC